jgi:hypothetical protein
MTQPQYEIYTKGTDGRRAGLVRDWTAVQLVFRWNDESKFTLSGSGRSACPFKRGTGIVVFRDGEAILSGLASSIESQYEADTEVWSWSVTGIDDIGLLARRVIYPDPTSADPSTATATAYTVTAKLETAVLGIIGMNAEEGTALNDRRIPNLTTAVSQGAGDEVTLTSSFDEVLDFILTALSDSSLGIRETWKPKTGAFEIGIAEAVDRSRNVVFSVENGTLAGWKHVQEAPSANVIIARGMEITSTTAEATATDDTTDTTTDTETPKVYQWAVASDAESVERWGRIEKYVERSDISTIKDEEAGMEETPEETLVRLQKAAAEELLEAEGKESWSLTVTPTDMTAWRSAWNLGDTVAFVADGEKLTAQIAEVKVEFSDAVETVTPTIGTIERGELGEIFDALGNLKRRIRVQENKK